MKINWSRPKDGGHNRAMVMAILVTLVVALLVTGLIMSRGDESVRGCQLATGPVFCGEDE